MRYIDEQAFVDFTISCQGEQYGVHKIILIRGSGFFKKALNDASQFREAVENKMNLDEEDPILVEIMLRHLYSHAYLKDHPSPPDITLQLHARMYAMADRYGMEDLRQLVREQFENLQRTDYAKDDFATVIREVYTSTPDLDRGLRDLVVKQSTACFAEVSAKPDFFKMMAETGTFGVDLVKAIKNHASRKFACPNCKKSIDVVLEESGMRCDRCPHCWEIIVFQFRKSK